MDYQHVKNSTRVNNHIFNELYYQYDELGRVDETH